MPLRQYHLLMLRCFLISVLLMTLSTGTAINSSIPLHISKPETVKPGSWILGKGTSFRPFDHSSNQSFHCRLELRPKSDHFCIGKGDGTVRLVRPLDTDESPGSLLQQVRCFGGSAAVGRFVVEVEDVNDNAPELKFRGPIIVHPSVNRYQQFEVVDPDAKTGGNITAKLTDSYWSNRFNLFCINQLLGKGLLCNLTSKPLLQQLDGPVAYVPLQVTDGASPEMSATRFIPIHLTNSSAIKDARIHIQVFNFNGRTEAIYLRSILVQVAVRIWNSIRIKQLPDGVTLDEHGDVMHIDLSSVKPGTHELHLTVTDNGATFDVRGEVHIQNISKKELKNAGSIRIQNIRAEDFLRPLARNISQYDTLREFLAKTFNATLGNVTIFSIVSEDRHPEILQIYFLINGTRRKPTFINGVLSFHKEELERELGLGAKVVQVGVNDCVFENCGGGCKNDLMVAEKPVDWNAEYNRFVGIAVQATTKEQEHCQDPAPENCSSTPCLNRGLCHDLPNTGVFCQCEFGTGPYCQGRMRTFHGAGSYAWLDPIRPCESFHLSFYFMTEQKFALLLYNGPIIHPVISSNVYSTTDFIGLYISNGNVELTMDLGSGLHYALSSNVDVSDGHWHLVDVLLRGGNLTLTVDDDSGDGAHKIDDEFVQLNVNDPLQLGGLARFNEQASYANTLGLLPSLDGTIRDLYVNEVMQDLKNPVHAVGSEAGCAKTETVCSDFCEHGLCVSSMKDTVPKCDCDIGYHGPRCDQKVTWYQFSEDSYIEYDFASKDTTKDDIKMMVAIKEKNGVLFHAADKNSGHRQLKVSNWHLSFESKHKRKARSIIKPNLLNLTTRLHAMEPYYVHLIRKSESVSLSLDSGPPLTEFFHESTVPYTKFYIGAESALSEPTEDFQGCIAQIFYNSHPFPLSESSPMIKAIANVSEGCSILPTCDNTNLQCPPDLLCQDFWKGSFCTCAPGAHPIFDPDEEDHWTGHCQTALAYTLGITTEAIIIIVICLIVLLCLILLLVLCLCRRRRRRPFSSLTPSPRAGFHENLGRDDSYGAGEGNQSKYDKNVLRVPLLSQRQRHMPSAVIEPGPLDEKRLYGVELPSETTGSLSPLPSDDEEDVNWLQIEKFGPKFARLTEIR